MLDKPIYLTPEGRQKLQEELDMLRDVKRAEVAEAIRSAKEEGDISENSAYDAAKEQQAFIEGRIMYLEGMLKNAVPINEALVTDFVGVGSHVSVKEAGSSEEETYQIVGSAEADPRKGRISNESPVGRALMGKKKGESVVVKTPAGERKLKIISVS
ncbi:MAG: transcription elongation factor GreA [Anaerolineae bacterium]